MRSHAVPVVLSLLVAGCAAPLTPGPAGDARPAPTIARWTWDERAALGQERTEATAVAVAGRLYLLGGLYPGPAPPGLDQTVRRVDVYDPGNDTWTEGPALPLPLHHAPAVAVGDRVFVLGGYTGFPFVTQAATWVLDASLPLDQQAWTRWVPLPAPRGAHAAATDGTVVWIFGGAGPPGPYPLAPQQVVLEPSVWAISPGEAAPAWRRVADLPDPRDHLAGAFLDGKVYAVGGRDLSLTSNTERVDVYDPGNDTWTEAPHLPTPRGGLGAAVLAGQVVALGGEEPDVALDAAEAYDPVTQRWSALPPMPEGRHGLGVAAVGEAVYAVTGGPGAGAAFSGTTYRLRLG